VLGTAGQAGIVHGAVAPDPGYAASCVYRTGGCVMLIWMWIKRRRAAKGAKAAALETETKSATQTSTDVPPQ
jgi:hypothetical protein